jgi:hypothetical protein
MSRVVDVFGTSATLNKRRRKKRKKAQKMSKRQIERSIQNLQRGLGKALQGVEHKVHGYYHGATTTWVGGLIILNTISQGDENSQRIGDSLVMKSLEVRMLIDSAMAVPYTRVCLIIDKQNTITAVSDFITLGSAALCLSYPIFNNRAQYSLIMDKCFLHDDVFNTNVIEYFKYSLRDTKTIFTATTTTIETNAVKLIYWSPIVSSGSSIEIQSRIIFKDE